MEVAKSGFRSQTLMTVDISQIGVLIVDDVKTMQVHVKDMLRSQGFTRMFTASGGEEAKKILLEQGPSSIHLVLCDWHMVPTDGLAVVRFVRGEPLLSSTTFVMVTAENTKEQVIQAIAAGVDDYLMKPITIDQIATKVMAALRKRKFIA